METKSNVQLYHHTFAPWCVDGERRVVAIETAWKTPEKLNRLAAQLGARYRLRVDVDVFEDWAGPMVDAAGDVLDGHRSRPMTALTASSYDPLTMSDVRRRLFDLIDATQNIDYLLVTKRPENAPRMWPSADIFDPKSEHKAFWNNVQLLASVEDQAAANRRVEDLLKCRDLVPVLGLSCEPLLGPLELFHRDEGVLRGPAVIVSGGMTPSTPDAHSEGYDDSYPGIDWVIVGSESGPNRRPMKTEWAESLFNQCRGAGVTFFMKQMEVSGKVTGDVSDFPELLRVREFPMAQKMA